MVLRHIRVFETSARRKRTVDVGLSQCEVRPAAPAVVPNTTIEDRIFDWPEYSEDKRNFADVFVRLVTL